MFLFARAAGVFPAFFFFSARRSPISAFGRFWPGISTSTKADFWTCLQFASIVAQKLWLRLSPLKSTLSTPTKSYLSYSSSPILSLLGCWHLLEIFLNFVYYLFWLWVGRLLEAVSLGSSQFYDCGQFEGLNKLFGNVSYFRLNLISPIVGSIFLMAAPKRYWILKSVEKTKADSSIIYYLAYRSC